MTENEVIEWQKAFKKTYKGVPKDVDTACDIAIKALEEIQQYRAIGTVEEIKKNMAELGGWRSDRLNDKIKNPFACMSTLICHNCDHKDEYIEELEFEIEEYKEIGTVEECREARERQRAKKIIIDHTGSIQDRGKGRCPNCGLDISCHGRINACFHCGQILSWECDTD